MSITKEFQKRFIGLVDTLGVSKTQCAKEIGISYKTFNNAYTFGKIPRTRLLIEIADYFDVSLDYLLCLTDKKERIKNIRP